MNEEATRESNFIHDILLTTKLQSASSAQQ